MFQRSVTENDCEKFECGYLGCNKIQIIYKIL